MRSSDAHLERALEEYNDKVNDLESRGERKELLDAYINRGCVLSMMGCSTSAIDDFNEAIDIMTELENSGNSVDAGYFVKAFISRGELQTDEHAKNMADDYRIAASRLKELCSESKYFDERKILELCIVCAGDLIENEYPLDSRPFTDKGLSMVIGKEDVLSRNAYVEISNFAGQACMDIGENQKAHQYFTESVRMGQSLFDEDQLADEMDLVLAYVSKGDMDEVLGLDKEFFADREAAIEMMEDMRAMGSLDDEELLSNLHGEVAQAYMKKGDIKSAEKHLLKQVSYNLSGSTEYLNENAE